MLVNIQVNRSNGKINLNIEGHANYGPNGQDIVCSAISSIILTALLGLEAVSENYPNNVTYKEIYDEKE